MANYIKQVKIDEVINGVSTPKIYDVYDKSALHSLPDNVVTTDGAQTISGRKNFTGGETVKSSGNAVLNIEGVPTTTDYIDLYVSGGSNAKRPLVINNNSTGSGNVGIGTAVPSERLEVSGNVKATKFIGKIDYSNVNGTPDLSGYATTAQVQAAQDAADAAAQDAADAMTEAGTKQNKLTGTAGQVVGFDASGNAVAQDLSAPTPYTVATATLNKSSNVTTTSISGYANDWYVAVSGLTTSSTFEVLVNSTAANVVNQFKQLGYARCSTNGRLTFACRLKPTVNVPIVVRIYS